MTYAIDTHASIKRLADAGMPDNQAEALVELMAQQREDVATKTDIAALQSATKTDIAALQSATKADIAALQSATKADIAAINDKITTLQSNMATKADIAMINNKIATMATKIDLAEMKTQLLISMIALGGVMITLVGVMIAAIRLF